MKGYPCSVSGYQTCIVVTFTHSASFCVDGQVRKIILVSYFDSWIDQVNWQAGTLMILYVVASLVISFSSLRLVNLIPLLVRSPKLYLYQVIGHTIEWRMEIIK